MYESILKEATGNPKLKFKITTAPFPVRAYQKEYQDQANGVFTVFVVAIGFALIPASMISYIVNERVKNLKHMQVLSGMSVAAYWTSNMIFDIMKVMIPAGIAIGLLYVFDFFVSFKSLIMYFSMITAGNCSYCTLWPSSLSHT